MGGHWEVRTSSNTVNYSLMDVLVRSIRVKPFLSLVIMVCVLRSDYSLLLTNHMCSII